jgi:hypothetical protein
MLACYLPAERDYMELLGAGGFKHWTKKQKQRLVGRAMDQASKSATSDADDAAARFLLASRAHTLKLSTEFSDLPRQIYDKCLPLAQCWFSLMPDSQLWEEGDVLCLGGFVPPRSRNLPLCSVSSALVLNRPLLAGQLIACPTPMSFLALRGILENGRSIARGPHGAPINAVFTLLPRPDDVLSLSLARCYAAIATSQLLTTRWVYTVGTAEYKNGALAALVGALVPRSTDSGEAAEQRSANEISSSERNLMMLSLSSYFCVHFSFVSSTVLPRARALLSSKESTSGEVPTLLVAAADQLILTLAEFNAAAQHTQPSCPPLDRLAKLRDQHGLFQTLFLRILRDALGDAFTAFCDAGDPDGDKKRKQKDVDAETFIEILTDGLNWSKCENPTAAQTEFLSDLGWTVQHSEEPLNLSGISLSESARKETDAVSVDGMCDFDTFFDEHEEEDIDSAPAPAGPSMSADTTERREGLFAHVDATTRARRALYLHASRATTSEDASAAVRHPLRPRALVETVLKWQARLGSASGSPSSRSTGEEALARADLTDVTRVAIVNSLLLALRTETAVLLRLSSCLRILDSMCRELSGQPVVTDAVQYSDLPSLLGFETNTEGFQLLLAEIIRAVDLRSNSRYRGELASAAEFSLLKAPPVEVIKRFHSALERKRISAWEAAEAARKAAAKDIFRRAYLVHPLNLAPLPLVIMDAAHLQRINEWVADKRGFSVLPAVSPITDEWTGMSSNTFLTLRSKFFLSKSNPYEAIKAIFGGGDDRTVSLYCEHLHTFAMATFTETLSEEASSGNDLEAFDAKMDEKYGRGKLTVGDVTSLWVSMAFKHFSGTVDVADLLRRCSKSAADRVSLLREEIHRQNEWRSNPAKFLTDYFTNLPSQPKLQLAEYLDWLEQGRMISRRGEAHVVVSDADSVQLATDVWEEERVTTMS